MTIHAHTDQGCSNPAYVNISERVSYPGDAIITVRSAGENDCSSMILGEPQLKALADDINRHLGQPRVFTFDQFVQHGRDHGANIVDGMPWSWQFEGYAVTHETDQRYLICHGVITVYFCATDLLILSADGRIGTCFNLI